MMPIIIHGFNLDSVGSVSQSQNIPEIQLSFFIIRQIEQETRMHSSRMRTGRSLTVCCSLLPGGVCLLRGGGVPGPRGGGGCLVPGGRGVPGLGGLVWGVSAPRGSVCVSGLGGVCSRGVPGPRGVCLAQGGVCSQGVVCSWGGGVCSRGDGIPACTEADTPPPCGQTHTCKNITLAQLHCGL